MPTKIQLWKYNYSIPITSAPPLLKDHHSLSCLRGGTLNKKIGASSLFPSLQKRGNPPHLPLLCSNERPEKPENTHLHFWLSRWRVPKREDVKSMSPSIFRNKILPLSPLSSWRKKKEGISFTIVQFLLS